MNTPPALVRPSLFPCLIAVAAIALPASAVARDGSVHWMLPADEISSVQREPSTFRAEGQGAAGDAFEAVAREFLAERLSGAAGLGASEMVLRASHVDAQGNHHYRFGHFIDSVAIGDTELLVHIAPSGKVFGYNGFKEPGSEQLRARTRSHLGRDGLRLSQPQLIKTVQADMGEGELEIVKLGARIDGTHDTVYWLVKVRSMGLTPQTNVYHIADSADAEILHKDIELRSFLPFVEPEEGD